MLGQTGTNFLPWHFFPSLCPLRWQQISWKAFQHLRLGSTEGKIYQTGMFLESILLNIHFLVVRKNKALPDAPSWLPLRPSYPTRRSCRAFGLHGQTSEPQNLSALHTLFTTTTENILHCATDSSGNLEMYGTKITPTHNLIFHISLDMPLIHLDWQMEKEMINSILDIVF